MDFRSLEAFLLTCEEASVTRAAARLGLTQPAVSTRVRALEHSLGRRLLQRRNGRLEPTAAGRDLLERARPLVALARDLDAYIHDAGRLRHGALRFGADGPFEVMPLLARFRERYPGMRVEVRIGNTARVVAELTEGETDAAVLTLERIPATLAAAVLGEDRLVALLPRDHPAAPGGLALERFAREPVILRERGSATRALFEQALDERAIRLQSPLELGSREAVREAVAAGLGIAVVLAAEQPPDPRLVTVPIVDVDRRVKRCLACRADRRELTLTRALFALAKAGGDGRAGDPGSSAAREGPANCPRG